MPTLYIQRGHDPVGTTDWLSELDTEAYGGWPRHERHLLCYIFTEHGAGDYTVHLEQDGKMVQVWQGRIQRHGGGMRYLHLAQNFDAAGLSARKTPLEEWVEVEQPEFNLPPDVRYGRPKWARDHKLS